MARRYDICFDGELTAGQDAAVVKERLVTLFGSPAKIEALFAGGRVLVKRNVSAEDAQRYQLAFQQAGARCELVPVPDTEPPAAPTSPPAHGTVPLGKAGHGTLVYGSPRMGVDYIAPTVPPPEPLRVPVEATRQPVATPLARAASPQAPAVPLAPVGAQSPALAIPDLEVHAPRTSPPPARVAAPVVVAAVAAGTAALAERDRLEAFDAFDAFDVPAGPGAGAFGDLDAEAASLEPAALDQVVNRGRHLAPAEYELDAPSLEIERVLSGPGAQHDVSLPRLVRDPHTGRVSAEPAEPALAAGGAAPQRALQAAPPHAPGAAPATAPPPAALAANVWGAVPATVGTAAATGVIRTGHTVDDLDAASRAEHTVEMARAVDASRFGMTVTALGLLLFGVLGLCNAASALVKVQIGGFVIATVIAAIVVAGGAKLWKALGKLPSTPVIARTEELADALDAQADFWQLWGIINLLGAGAIVLGVGAALLLGLATGLTQAFQTDTAAASPRVSSWHKTPTATGFAIELECSDRKRRAVTCRQSPPNPLACACSVDGVAQGEFESRSEPENGEQSVAFANEGCGWDLELDLSLTSY